MRSTFLFALALSTFAAAHSAHAAKPAECSYTEKNGLKMVALTETIGRNRATGAPIEQTVMTWPIAKNLVFGSRAEADAYEAADRACRRYRETLR